MPISVVPISVVPRMISFFVPPSTGKYRIVARKAFAVLRGQILDTPKHGNI